MFKSALLILSGNAMASLLLLARNLIIARLIPVEDYGVAATFAVAMAVVEMASAFGLQQQIVQSKEGDDPKFQAGLQGFQLLRGVISGVILFLLAGPLAAFLGIPEVAWAYQVLALVPVLNALQHFDIHRLTRAMQFKALLLTGSLPALISLIAVWPLVTVFGNWQVMLWALLLQAALAALVSHICAERRWQLSLDRAILAKSMRFGWPLLLNSILMFLVFQGDKLIVGRLQGMEALAVFSMGVTLLLTPTLVFAKSAQNLFLPKLSAAQEDPEAFARIAQRCLQTVALAALALVLGTLLLGGPVVHLLLGEKYAPLLPLLIWFATSQALRMAKAGPAIVALALGQTSNALWANVLRSLCLPLAWVVAERGGSLLDILLIATLGEALGLVVALALMLRRAVLPGRAIVVQQGLMAVMVLALGALVWIAPELLEPSPNLPQGYIWLGAFFVFGLLFLAMPEQRRKRSASLIQEPSFHMPADTPAATWTPQAAQLAAAREGANSHRVARKLAALYRHRRLRGLVQKLCLRLEGGVMFSTTWRQILRQHHGANIGAYSYGDILKPGVLPGGTTVGRYCSVGAGLIVRRRDHPLERPSLHPFFYNAKLGLLTRDSIKSDRDNPLVIGHDVWIADRVTILGGCRSIGNGAVIAAGAVVTKDVPPYAVVAGVPAKVIKMRFDESRIAELEESQWWQRPIAELIKNPPFEDFLGTAPVAKAAE